MTQAQQLENRALPSIDILPSHSGLAVDESQKLGRRVRSW